MIKAELASANAVLEKLRSVRFTIREACGRNEAGARAFEEVLAAANDHLIATTIPPRPVCRVGTCESDRVTSETPLRAVELEALRDWLAAWSEEGPTSWWDADGTCVPMSKLMLARLLNAVEQSRR